MISGSRMATPAGHLHAPPEIILRSSQSNPLFLSSTRNLLFCDAAHLGQRQRRRRAAALRSGAGLGGWSSSSVVRAVLDRHGAALRASEVKRSQSDDRPKVNACFRYVEVRSNGSWLIGRSVLL